MVVNTKGINLTLKVTTNSRISIFETLFSISTFYLIVGDYVCCQYDKSRGTLSFGVNGDDPQVAFENLPREPLYPFVLFYMVTPGEKVTFFLAFRLFSMS